MNNNDDRYIDLLYQVIVKQDEIIAELKVISKTLGEHSDMLSEHSRILSEHSQRLERLEGEMTKMNREMRKINLQLGENTRAIFKLADEVEKIGEHDVRIRKLEEKVFG